MILSYAVPTVATLAISTLLIGCETGPTIGWGWDPPTIESIRGDWVIERIDGELVSETIPDGPLPLMLTINSDGVISGFSGVNSFKGSIDIVSLNESRWVSGPFSTTKMVGSPELMAFEQDLLSGLQGNYLINYHEGDVLTLLERDFLYTTYLRRPSRYLDQR